MNRYEEYPPVDVDLDPLTWWRDEQKKFPVLGSLGRKHLCMHLWHQCTIRKAF